MDDKIYTFSFVFLFFFFFFFFSFGITSAAVLYDEADKVLLLNSSNFKETIVGTKNAWIIQFFNSWCGHCIAFAPVWKSFAEDVYNWRRIIRVAAIDCSVPSNEKLCREYEVHSFPTIKFFKSFSSDKDLGMPYKGVKNEEVIRHKMMDFLSTLPDISAIESKSVLETKQNVDSFSYWENISSNVKVLIFVAEENNSYIGKEVLFDLLNFPNVKVIRILPDNALLLNKLNIKNFPTFITLSRSIQHYNGTDFDRKVFLKSVSTLLSLITDEGQDEFGRGDEGNGAGESPVESSSVDTTVEIKSDEVNLVDLENALYYTFSQEVPLRKKLDNENLQALKDFVHLLTKYFPARLPVKNFLQKILDWLNLKTEILMDDYLKFFNTSQSVEAYLPPMRPWVGCQGSHPNLRGYPCSLWVLFHTLTVEHYVRRKEDKSFDPQLVLKVMTGYIKNFFSCSECSQHFQEMAKTFPEEIVEDIDGVLWLWKSHNKVNARLKGAPSEDPHHPKLQFPSKDLCSSCQSSTENGDKWDIPNVTNFLLSYYSTIKILNSSLDSDNESQNFVHSNFPRGAIFLANQDNAEGKLLSRPLIRNQRNINMHMNFEKLSDPEVKSEIRQSSGSWGFNKVDMSLCVMLYIFSTGILLTVYFVVIVKRRLRKKLPFYSSKYSV